MTKGEGEHVSRGFEMSTNGKSIEVFGLRSVGKQVESDRNFVGLSELSILFTEPPTPNSYAVFPCKLWAAFLHDLEP